MLVLALQFSKGSERGRTLGDYLTRPLLEVIGRANRAGRSVGRGSVSSVPGAEGPNPYGSTPSKRKRRQSSSSRRVKRTNPAIDQPFRLTHQCTNWEWFEPGRTNAYQRLNCSP